MAQNKPVITITVVIRDEDGNEYPYDPALLIESDAPTIRREAQTQEAAEPPWRWPS